MKSVDDVVAELRLKVAKNLARDVGIVSIDCDDALALCQMAADFAVMLAEGKRDISALQSEADRLREALENAAKRLDVAATRMTTADAEFGFRIWADEARAALSATQQDASPVQPAQKTEGA